MLTLLIIWLIGASFVYVTFHMSQASNPNGPAPILLGIVVAVLWPAILLLALIATVFGWRKGPDA